ncbi:hypothetical protein F5148DRAFT_161043 [Russula earlei]|uniref:Uncharacterized protein n=1 Tax=Russula earlei TaxID=71964 RepID=A0ACC0U5Z8_9AGAM|nr:hypothetical protein F5148DRAFT_161043 [Russula earlei]
MSPNYTHPVSILVHFCANSLCFSGKRKVYPIAMHLAKTAVANALIDGWKSVELCQAYIPLSIYAVPARRWEEDRSWLDGHRSHHSNCDRSESTYPSSEEADY